MSIKEHKRVHLVNQKIIVEILKSEEAFRKYIISNEIFSDEHIKELYINRIGRYVQYLLAHGYKFSETQKKIIDELSKVKDDLEYELSKVEDNLEYGVLEEVEDYEEKIEDYEENILIDYDKQAESEEEWKHQVKRNEKMRRTIMTIIMDENKFRDFLEGKYEYDGDIFNDLQSYSHTEDNLFEYYLSPDIFEGNSKLIKRLRTLYLFIELNPDITNKKLDFEINEDLEKKILSKVNKELLNKEERTAEEEGILAAEIYDALNMFVAYDEKIHLQNQLEIIELNETTEITKAFYKNPEKVSEKDNRVICRSWSKLYAKLLRKYGITAYVMNSKCHMNAIVLDKDHNIYVADATNTQDPGYRGKCGFWGPDIVKSKLGLNHTNFYRLSLNFANMQIKEYYRDGEFVKPIVRVSRDRRNFKGKKMGLKSVFSDEEKKLFDEFLYRALNDEPIDENECSKVLRILKIIEKKGKVPTSYLNIGGKQSSNNISDENVRKEISPAELSQRIKVINRIMLALKPRIQDDNLVNVILTTNFCYYLLDAENVEKIDKIYKIDKNGNVKAVPVIYMEIDPNNEYMSMQKKHMIEKHIYTDKFRKMERLYIFDEEKGFVEITRKQVMEGLEKKELYYNYYDENQTIWTPIQIHNSIEAQIRDSKQNYAAYECLR